MWQRTPHQVTQCWWMYWVGETDCVWRDRKGLDGSIGDKDNRSKGDQSGGKADWAWSIHVHGEESVAFSRSIGVEFDCEGSFISGGLRQALDMNKHCYDYWPQKVVNFVSMKCPCGFFFLYPVLCYVADNVNKQISFHGNAPHSCKHCTLIKTALTIFSWRLRCRKLLLTRQTWNRSNALCVRNSEL